MTAPTMDDVFLRFGRVMCGAQRIEQDVENFAWALLKQRGEANRRERDWLEGRTLGEIWRRIDGDCRAADDIWAGNIKVFVRRRNYMSHHFFLDAAPIEAADEMIASALTYLDEFDYACAIASYHLRLLIDAMSVDVAARFPLSVEEKLARQRGIDADTTISFRSYTPHA